MGLQHVLGAMKRYVFRQKLWDKKKRHIVAGTQHDSAIGFNRDISRSGGPSTFPIKRKVNPVRDMYALGLGDTKQGPESSVVRGSSGLEENKARLANA